MTSRFSVLAIDSVDPARLAEFWCAVLGWGIVEQDEAGISIGPEGGRWPTIDVLHVPEAKHVKNRLHLDLRADGLSTSEELDRLLELGARREDIGQGEAPWVVLADPEGNEFCLLPRSVQDLERAE